MAQQLTITHDLGNQRFQVDAWTDNQRHTKTTITLTRHAISWENSKKGLVFEISKVTGAKPSLSDPTSISIQTYNSVSKRFKVYNFWFLTIETAQLWFQMVRNYSRECQEIRNIAIILNPISGSKSGRKVWQTKFQPALSYSGIVYSVYETTDSNFIDNWVKNRDIKQFTDIVCMGGDGTMHLLITAINKYHKGTLENINFGILPTGSRNALACEIGSKKSGDGIMNIIKGRTFKADLLQVRVESEVTLATCAVSWGIVSDITDEAQHYRFLGTFRYTAVGLKRFIQKWKKYSATVSYESSNGEIVSINSDFMYVVATNHRVQNVSNHEILAPEARINDGSLNLQIMAHGNKWKMIKTFKKTMQSGSHVSMDHITNIKSRLISLEPKSPLVYNVDGEMYYGSSIQVQVLPQMISYLGQLNTKVIETV